MSRRFSIRIPASTSNLGAGFDALSLALDRYLRVLLDVPSTAIPEGREFIADGVDAAKIPAGSDNLMLRVARRVAERRNRELPPFTVRIRNEIPLARGMGSSAAAIIAGITCYELAAGDRIPDREIFGYAMEFEPHPDNLAAALLGGLVAAATADDGEVLVAKVPAPEGVQAIVVIPDFELSTEKARAVLPQTYSRKDAVYNIQRSALMVASLATANRPLIREAMGDRIHQPYRARLIPGFEEVLKLNAPGLLGIALSGAGPTVFALAVPEHAEDAGRAIADIFRKHGVQAAPYLVNIDNEGRLIEQA
jgi:homoserine kinase